MNRNILFLVIFSLLTSWLSAQNVSKEEALKGGLNFYKNQINAFDIAKSDIIVKDYSEIKTKNNEVAIHLFNFEDGGFILMSGDKNSLPILAFSYEGYMDFNNMTPAAAAWIEGYKEDIEYVKKNNVINTENQLDWEKISSKTFSNSKDYPNYTQKKPLLKTKWGQSAPYNLLCPNVPINYNNGVGNCVTGCVATAMAQIMKYYNFPDKGIGIGEFYYDTYHSVDFSEGTYNWNKMKNEYGWQWTPDSVEAYAVAKLMYHCGVAAKLDYGPDATGLSSSEDKNVIKALISNFGYRNGIVIKDRTTIPTNEWLQMIMDELDLNRPVFYLGYNRDFDGHAFVCDGYIKQGKNMYFSFNFGWNGLDDAYYNIYKDNNSVGDNTMAFSGSQRIIIGIAPSGLQSNDFPFCIGRVLKPFTEGEFDDGSAENLYKKNTDCEWLISTEDVNTDFISYDSLSIGFNYIDLGEGDTLKIYNGKSLADPLIKTITLKNNYKVGNPEVLFVRAHKSNPNLLLKFTTNATDNRNGWQIKYEIIKILANTGIADNILENLNIYPNPANDHIRISGLIGNETIQILDITGRELFNGSSTDNIDVFNFQKGIYFIKISLDGSNKTMKFIKE